MPGSTTSGHTSLGRFKTMSKNMFLVMAAASDMSPSSYRFMHVSEGSVFKGPGSRLKHGGKGVEFMESNYVF